MLGGEGSGRGGGGEGAAAMKKGPWTAAEDAILMEYVKKNGEGNWNAVQRNSGLLRCGKSCRLRWANHLRPNLKKGSFTPEEERLILELHAKLGNKWARMATQLPGRTDNEIKNYWNTRIKRRQRAGLPLYPPDIHHQNNFFQQHHHQSRQGMQTDNKTQFPGNPTPLSLLDPIPIGFSSTSSTIAASPSSLMGHSLFGSGGNSQPFFAHSTARPQQQFKRPREEGLGLPTMFFRGQAAPVVRFGSRNNVMGLQQQQQQQHYSPFSVKMELPSSQVAPAPPGDGEDPWGRNNSGLLDALLEDAQGGCAAATNRRIAVCDPSMEMLLPKSTTQEEADRKGPAEDVKLSNGKSNGNGGSFGLPPENKMKNELVENVASENEDLSALFDFMPPSQISMEANPTATNWFKNDSGEMSNGQSSGVTEDDIGLEMQQLASSLSMAAEGHAWNIGSDHWDNMPGIC